MEDQLYMKLALQQAAMAAAIGEVPVGAIVVQKNKIVGQGFNMRETQRDPTAHAEMIAIRDAAKTLGGWRLPECTMYVTLEPCAMCAAAIVHARIDRVVFGVRDPKTGFTGSLGNLLQDERLNHQAEITEGVLAEECGQILSDFFKDLRQKNK